MSKNLWVDASTDLRVGDTWFLHTIAANEYGPSTVLLPWIQRSYLAWPTSNVRPASVEKIITQTRRALVRVLEGAEREVALDALGYAEVDLGR